jgi:hypothetical protein
MTAGHAPAAWHYRPGDHWAVVGPTASALLMGNAALGLAQRIWTLLSDPAGGVERVLDEMAHDGVAGLPSFVLVEHAGDGVRALVRGTAEARVHCEDDPDPRVVSGVGFRSWREEAVSAVAAVRLSNSTGPAPTGPELPVRGGIVRASELRLQLRPGGVRPPDIPAASRSEPTAASGVRAADAALTLDQSAFDPDGEPPATPPGTPPPEEAKAVPPPDPEPTPAPPPDPAPAPAPPAEPAGVARRPGDDYLELLAGMTRMGTVEDAAVRTPMGVTGAALRPVSPPEVSSTETPPADPPAVDVPPAGATDGEAHGPAAHPRRTPSAAPAPAPTPGPRTSPGLISSVPFSSARPATSGSAARMRGPAPLPSGRAQPPAPSGGGGADEEAELTVVRLPTGTATGQGGAASPRSGGLPAVLCPRSHANPPESEHCRVCGDDLSGAERQWVDRPSIGRLRFDGPPGVVPVTGPMVIGRAPRVDRVSGDAVPTIVTVPSTDGDISRSHLRIAVEGWHVMVIDLNATNGTVVQEPSGESRRLHPGEEKMIVPGSRVIMADLVGFVFEAQE